MYDQKIQSFVNSYDNAEATLQGVEDVEDLQDGVDYVKAAASGLKEARQYATQPVQKAAVQVASQMLKGLESKFIDSAIDMHLNGNQREARNIVAQLLEGKKDAESQTRKVA